MTDKLMLEYHAGGNYLVFDNPHSELVTALPYIDEKVDEAYRDRVQGLIREEMRAMGSSRDYLSKLPLPALPHLVSLTALTRAKESDFVKGELERISNGERLQAIDQTRYLQAEEPLDKGDLMQWQAAVDQANINFQYAENR